MLFNITVGALISAALLTVLVPLHASLRSAQQAGERTIGVAYVLSVIAGTLTKLVLLFGPGIIIAGALTLAGVI